MGLQVDVTKFVTMCLVVGGTVFLTYAGKVDAQACVALLGAAMGYVFGNGSKIAADRRAAGILARQDAAKAEAAAHG